MQAQWGSRFPDAVVVRMGSLVGFPWRAGQEERMIKLYRFRGKGSSFTKVRSGLTLRFSETRYVSVKPFIIITLQDIMHVSLLNHISYNAR